MLKRKSSFIYLILSIHFFSLITVNIGINKVSLNGVDNQIVISERNLPENNVDFTLEKYFIIISEKGLIRLTYTANREKAMCRK